MDFIYNIKTFCVNFIKDNLFSFYSNTELNPELNDLSLKSKEIEDIHYNEIHYFFINTANIYNATKLMIDKLNNSYKNKPIKIYLLKSDTLKPLFYNNIIATDKNIKKIHKKLKTHRIHLHTFVDAIDSFIEYNNLHNYSIFY
jgi:hypothetical protein